ncbi:hypothetical protein ACVWVY_000679 [Bradyrhizobium sp. URHC0002]
MPGLVPGIHVLPGAKDVDGRDKPGHDGWENHELLHRALGGFGKLLQHAVALQF